MPAQLQCPIPMEIYYIDTTLNLCHDRRYCLVLDAPHKGRVPVLHLSAQIELYQSHLDFFISAKHSDFKTTGLKKDSYAMPRILDEPLSKFTPAAARGKLIGTMLHEFEIWFGWK